MSELAPDGKKLGWHIEGEDFDAIDALPEGPDFTYAVVDEFAYKDVKTALEVVRVEDQNGFGACQGHAVTSVNEWAQYLQTGEIVELSRWMGYVGTQKIDRLSGDVGSTIWGGSTLMLEYGVCPEADFPYPRSYSQRITEEQYKAALPYRLKTRRKISSVEDARAWVGGRVGGISIGVAWGGGGHAIAILHYDKDADTFWYLNSWSERWGTRGWGKWTSRELAQKFRENYTRAVGMTEMLEVKEPRKCDWLKKGHARW